MPRSLRPHTRRQIVRRGLTLIELVVVMAIIAILSVMVIPRLDFLKTQAEHSSSAGTQADLGAMIQTFKASSGRYPSFDTLVSSAGSVYSKLQAQTTGTAVEATTIPGPSSGQHWYRSFSDAGFQFGYQHDEAATDASASGTAGVDIVAQGVDGTLKVATIKATGGGTLATALRNAIYPGSVVYTPASLGPDGVTGGGDDVAASSVQTGVGEIPATSKLVVFGVGPKSNLITNVVATAPSSAMGSDDSTKTYCRYLVVFEVFSNGNPAKFRMVTDHRLRQIGARIDMYKQGSAIQ
jgi:prepilin-type N-terminal cleavage/methylation domain-containing protein